MSIQRFAPFSAAAMCMLLISGGLTATAQDDQVAKIGKKGQVTLSSETKIGDLTLMPGQYTVQCRQQGEEHIMRFTRTGVSAPRGGGPAVDKGEVKCKKEPLPSKVAAGSLHSHKDGDIVRVTKIEIAGEKVAHLFE
jgi:hypothetical protein